MDVRTVAGRLGHSGGGTTTLRTYAAWVSEADQRAASGIATRMPSRPTQLAAVEHAQQHHPRSPYERIAAELRRRILSGALAEGDAAPTVKQLAAEHQVSIGTAHRTMELLKAWGLLTSSRGRRAIVARPPELAESVSAERPSDLSVPDAVAETSAPQLWAITVRGPDGRRYPARHVCEDVTRPESFRSHLLAIVRVEEPSKDPSRSIGDYELEIRAFGKEHLDPILTLRWQL